MPTLTAPELPPGTLVHYSGEIRYPRSEGRVEALEYLGSLMTVQHLLSAAEESTMLFRGLGLDSQQTANLLCRDVVTINTHSTHAFAALGRAGSITIAIHRLFMPEYGPILTVENPLELSETPDEELVRLVRFLSTVKNYDAARGYPGLSPDKVKRGISKYTSKLGLRNREELMFWANAARILGPGEMAIKPPPGPEELPLKDPAKNIPHIDFSIIPAKAATEGEWRFPRSAKLPPDAALKFEAGRLVKISGWGGSVVVNRHCELYTRVGEAEINHLGTVALGLTVEQSKVVTPNPDSFRRRFRRQFNLDTFQPVYHAVERSFEAGLLQLAQTVDPQLSPVGDSIWRLLPHLLSSRTHKTAATTLNMSERMLTYAVQRACEQLGVGEFGAVVTYSHLIGHHAGVK